MRSVNRHDPAPSRLKYRLERLLLTPLFRFSLRVLLPCAVTFGAATLWFSNQENQQALYDMVAEIRDAVEERPEFQVKLMAVKGASQDLAEAIRAELNVSLPTSSFDLDLEALQEKTVALDAVETATLRVKQGGTLEVDVVERQPAVLWREEGVLSLLDSNGVFVGPARSRQAHAQLPVVAGERALDAIPEALHLVAAAAPLTKRLRGLERMGARRWDVVLDRDQRILLPEKNAVQALERIIAMDQAVGVLDRDITAVDLRLPRRPTIRMTQHATAEMWRIKTIESGGALE